MSDPTPVNPFSYHFVAFGDEVPGILALISAAREYRRWIGNYPRSLLMFKRSSLEGIGGHLVRGRLAYLDRSQERLSDALLFGDPPAIYREFLQRSGVNELKGIALDASKADFALRQMLREAGVDILSNIQIQSVQKQDDKITSIQLANGKVYEGKQFIDASVNAELAQLAGVKKSVGYETLGLPDSELSVSIIFETSGLSSSTLKAIEQQYINRFANPADAEAQHWIEQAAGSDPQLALALKIELSRPQPADEGTDYLDVYSKALSVAYHSFRGLKMSLPESKVMLDHPNIAKLSGNRLSWNGLLFYVTAAEAEALARDGGRPTPQMQAEQTYIEKWCRSLGATSVRFGTELYIRHAGNVTGTVAQLSGTQMMVGGVPANQAIGSFSYRFDSRGGINGLEARADAKGVRAKFDRPVFNVGIQHALLKNVPNLAVVSPASGFTGYGSTVGRIVEFNVAVGQGVGIAAANALLRNRDLSSFGNAEVRQYLNDHLQDRGRSFPAIYGKGFPEGGIRQFEQQMPLP